MISQYYVNMTYCLLLFVVIKVSLLNSYPNNDVIWRSAEYNLVNCNTTRVIILIDAAIVKR